MSYNNSEKEVLLIIPYPDNNLNTEKVRNLLKVS